MKVYVNEKEMNFQKGIRCFQIKDSIKPNGDILILNGFPIEEDMAVNEGDKIVIIKRGEIPNIEELKNLMISRHTPYVYEKIKKSRVAIAGLGGLGSNVAIALARVGVGFLRVIDFDLVEPSNLNRQQYFINQIGMKKSKALKETIKNINPFIKVDDVDEYVNKDSVEKFFNDVDIVVEAFDKVENKVMLISEVLKNISTVKVVSASGMAGYFSNNLIKTRKINSRLYLCGDEESEAKIGCGLMAPRVGIVAHHEANMVLRMLLGEEEV